MLKSIDDDAVSTNYDVIVTFPIYNRFVAIWKTDTRRMGYNSYIPVNSSDLQCYKI